jgi:hypothetical protein
VCQQRLILKRASGVLLLRRVKTRLAQSRHAATLCYLSAFGGIVLQNNFARPSARLTLWQKVRRSIGPGSAGCLRADIGLSRPSITAGA